MEMHGGSGNFIALVLLALATLSVVFLLRRKSGKAAEQRKSPAKTKGIEPPRPAPQPPRIPHLDQAQKVRFRAPDLTIRVSLPEQVLARPGRQPMGAKLTWHPANESIDVAGLRLGAGMIYSAFGHYYIAFAGPARGGPASGFRLLPKLRESLK
jgi:hypothetical protein